MSDWRKEAEGKPYIKIVPKQEGLARRSLRALFAAPSKAGGKAGGFVADLLTGGKGSWADEFPDRPKKPMFHKKKH
jgi:hypothetical protein